MHRSTCSPMILLTLGAALLYVPGCASLTLPTFTAGKHAKVETPAPVAQVVCIWQPAEGRGLDDLPSRGFAGQIVFLSAKSPTPIEVQGDVTIYLFDDQTAPAERTRPLHVFHFVDGSWQTHLKMTAWGPTYQLFLPYARKGDHRASCSLAVQIDTPDGNRVTSEMANIVLPGSESVSDGTSSPFQPEHTRRPAGRVLATGNAARDDAADDVSESGQSPQTSAAPAGRSAANQAPKFESFSIPYDFQRANAR